MYAITKYIKPLPPMLSPCYFYTSLGVLMRTPIQNGMWIGWTDTETNNHFKAVRDYLLIKKDTTSS
jgi:hypothetical protein